VLLLGLVNGEVRKRLEENLGWVAGLGVWPRILFWNHSASSPLFASLTGQKLSQPELNIDPFYLVANSNSAQPFLQTTCWES